MAEIVASIITTNSITIYLDGLDSDWKRGGRYVQYIIVCTSPILYVNKEQYLDGGITSSLENTDASQRYVIIDGLNNGSKYTITAAVYADDTKTERIATLRTEITTLPGVVPNKWSWEFSNGSATDTETQNAKRAIDKTSGYYVRDFDYYVWNDLVNKLNEVVFYKGNDWDSTYLSAYETTMYGGDTFLTADRFNSVRKQLWFLTSAVPYVNTKDEVIGEYFIALTNKINEWIDSDGIPL